MTTRIVVFNDAQIRITPDNKVAITDVVQALGYTKQQFPMLRSKHPGVFDPYIDSYRFAQGPEAIVMNLSGLRKYADMVQPNKPQVNRLYHTIKRYFEEDGRGEDDLLRQEIRQILLEIENFLDNLSTVDTRMIRDYLDLTVRVKKLNGELG